MALSANARRGVVLVAALVGMGITARAGFWQLDRARQKLALAAAIAQQGALPPLPGASLAADDATATEQAQRRVDLTGRWAQGEGATLFLDNRQMQGRPGFFVLTPLLLPAGDAVLVQRGWVPRDQLDRTRLPEVPTPPGEVQLTARVVPWPSRLTQLGDDAPGVIRQNVDRPTLAAAWHLALRPLSVQQLPEGSAAQAGPDGLLRDWPQPAVDVDKHYGYAAQWFTFCAMIASLYVWFQLVRPRRAARG